jgi:hypothetical protein
LRLAAEGRIRYRPNPAVRPENLTGSQTVHSRPTAGETRQVRFPTGNGQAPGIKAGLGVSGAGSSAAGWAVGVSGAARRRGAAGFFLAAFFRADFTVGFFLAVFRAGARRADLAVDRVFRAGFPATLFFLAGDFLAAFFPRADFFLVAM